MSFRRNRLIILRFVNRANLYSTREGYTTRSVRNLTNKTMTNLQNNGTASRIVRMTPPPSLSTDDGDDDEVDLFADSSALPSSASMGFSFSLCSSDDEDSRNVNELGLDLVNKTDGDDDGTVTTALVLVDTVKACTFCCVTTCNNNVSSKNSVQLKRILISVFIGIAGLLDCRLLLFSGRPPRKLIVYQQFSNDQLQMRLVDWSVLLTWVLLRTSASLFSCHHRKIPSSMKIRSTEGQTSSQE